MGDEQLSDEELSEESIEKPRRESSFVEVEESGRLLVNDENFLDTVKIELDLIGTYSKNKKSFDSPPVGSLTPFSQRSLKSSTPILNRSDLDEWKLPLSDIESLSLECTTMFRSKNYSRFTNSERWNESSLELTNNNNKTVSGVMRIPNYVRSRSAPPC